MATEDRAVEEATVNAVAEMWEGVWEPWRPAAGDRVRCVPSPECAITTTEPCAANRNGCPPGHHPGEYGMTGVVMRPGSFPNYVASHPYLVLWDRAITLPNGERPNCSCYAAIELEPLTEPAAPGAGGGET